jgi:hypothetical protein
LGALAVVDLLVIAAQIEGCIVDITGQRMLMDKNSFLCAVIPNLQITLMGISSWTVVLLSAERYLVVSQPLQTRTWCRRKHMAVAWTIIALSLAALNSCCLAFHKMYHLKWIHEHFPVCRSNRHLSWEIKQGFTLLTILLDSVLPSFFIIAFNIAICLTLRRSHNFRRQHSDGCREQKQPKPSTNDSSTTRILLAVSVT